MLNYRLCPDQINANVLLTLGYINPTDRDKLAAEGCFEAVKLNCIDAIGQTCGNSADHIQGKACLRNSWFTCNGFYDDDKGCYGVHNSALGSCYTLISRGYTAGRSTFRTMCLIIPPCCSDGTISKPAKLISFAPAPPRQAPGLAHRLAQMLSFTQELQPQLEALYQAEHPHPLNIPLLPR